MKVLIQYKNMISLLMISIMVMKWLYPIEDSLCIHLSLKWVIIGSDYSLLPVQRQAMTWTSDDLSQIWPLGTNWSEI